MNGRKNGTKLDWLSSISSRTRRYGPYLALILLDLALYSPLISGSHSGADTIRSFNTLLWPAAGSNAPVQSDYLTELLPWWFYLRESLLHGTLPFWSHLTLNGYPLGYNGQNTLFDPLTWIALAYSLLAGKWAGFGLLMALRTAVAGVGIYYFLRSSEFSRSVALVIAAPIMFSAYFVNFAGWSVIVPFAYAGWIFGAQFRILKKRADWVDLIVYAAAIGAMLLGGNMEDIAIVLFADLAWIILCGSGQQWSDLRQSLWSLMWPTVLGGLIGAIQVVPFLFQLGGSALWQQRTAFSAPNMQDLLLWLDPQLYSPQFIALHETYNFVGTGTLLLAIVGALSIRRSWPAIVMVLLTVVVAYHIWPGGYAWGLPLIGRVNLWRIMGLTPVFLASLAAEGITMATSRRASSILLAGVVGCAGTLMAVVLWAGFSRVGHGTGSAKVALLASGFLLLAQVVIVGLAGKWKQMLLMVTGVVLLVGVITLNPIYYGVPVRQVYPDSWATSWALRKQGLQPIAFAWPTAPLGVALAYGVHDFGVYDGVFPEAYLRYFQTLWWPPAWGRVGYTTDLQVFQSTNVAMLSAVGVRYVVTAQPGLFDVGTSKYATLAKLKQQDDVEIVRLSSASPFAYSPSVVTGVKHPLTFMATHVHKRGEAVVSDAVRSKVRGLGGSIRVKHESWIGDNELLIKEYANAPSVLVFDVVKLPGIAVSVNGKSIQSFPVNYLDQGVAVPKGWSTIQITYSPPGLAEGVCGSAAGAIVLALVHRRRRRSKALQGN